MEPVDPLPVQIGQAQALKAAGCTEIHEEQVSGGNRARPLCRLSGFSWTERLAT
jgi:hypothetical protein